MKTKVEKKEKAFNCVEMKRRAQAQLMAEYEARKNEFASYGEFIETKARELRWPGKSARKPDSERKTVKG